MSERSRDGIEEVDLARAIEAIDPAYFDAAHCGSAFRARVQCVHWCAGERRLYLVFAEAFVFHTDDGGATLHEVTEVNRRGGRLVAAGEQFVDAIVDTVRGTVLLAGRDRHDGDMAGVAWRKEKGAQSFERVVSARPAWASSKSGNLAAGFFGAGEADMVALAIYASPAQLYFSLDDGRSFRRQDLADVYLEHVHQVYLPRAKTAGRIARLWTTGGDDPDGRKSGVACFEALDADGGLGGMCWALRERPGYRLVGLAGDGKHVYVGNESVAGGVLKLLDNAQSIEAGDFEYALGKARHDYHQFRSLVATGDGLLASATDSYAFIGDTVRADSGGHFYVSADGGANFCDIDLGAKWCAGVAYDGASFWLIACMNRPDDPELSASRCSLLRVPRPPAFAAPSSPFVAKPVIVDSSEFYAMAGYASHPRAALAPGEASLRVDMGPFGSIGVDVETRGAATLAIEALPFNTWNPAQDPWRTLRTLRFIEASRQQLQLAGSDLHNRHFRLRNIGPAAVEFRFAAFTGRR